MSKDGAIALLLEARAKDIGELTVRRVLPDRRQQRVGPFIFFDHMGPVDFPAGAGVNVRPHPHIGLATITWLFAGEILHRDSLGFVQPIRPGEVNWMTAGKGIVHSERASPEVLNRGQHLHGIQTWVALPSDCEEIDPRFEHYTTEEIPRRSSDGIELKVIIGSAFGLESPVRTESRTIYVEANLAAGASLALPNVQELGVYVVAGEAQISGESLQPGQLAIVGNDATATVTASSDCKLMLLGGDKLEGERHLWWNFVSSSRERLEAAKNAWRDGDFDTVPGEDDFIPLPSI